MTHIIDGIWVGSVEDSFNPAVTGRVTHILNVAEELNIPERVDHIYLKCGVADDDPSEDIARIIPRCLQFIMASRATGGSRSCLVHCAEGKSRSVCVVVAYLVREKKMTTQEAVEYIRRLRPEIDIYPKYLEGLNN